MGTERTEEVTRSGAGLDQVLIKKKSKLELEKEAAASAPRQAAVKKQTPRVSASMADNCAVCNPP